MNQNLNSKQNYLTPKMNKTKYFLTTKFLKMKTLSQLLALGLCLFTFSTVVAQDQSADFWKNTGANIHTQGDRNIGIGTNLPKEMLHIQGGTTHGLTFKSAGNGWATIGNNWGIGGRITATTSSNTLQFTSAGDMFFNANVNGVNSWRCVMRINGDGRVAIGADGNFNAANDLMKTNAGVDITDYKLFVKDGILTEKVKVAVSADNDWADYVFEEDYERMPLDELEDFVTEKKHLPKVPSAEEMVENGLDVARMDAKLLEKIEEAYLYIIDLNKKVDALATENEGLKTSLQNLSTSGN